MIVTALSNYFDTVDHINLKEIEISISGTERTTLTYRGKSLPTYDCMYIKGSYRYGMLLRSITQYFENEKTYIPIHAESFIIVNDKLLTHLELDKSRIPMPKTYVVATVESAKISLPKMKFPIIIKLPQGTHGKGVMMVDTIASAKGLLDTLSTLNQPFLIQEFVECGGEDVRCFVVGDQVVASMKRKAAGEDIRSNLHSGGVAEKFEASPAMKEIAVKAAKQLGCDICGVDILETPQGGVVIEANVSPGLQGITKASGIDVAGVMAKFLYEKTKEKLDGNKEAGKKILEQEITYVNTPVNNSPTQDIIVKLDFRGNRILLPESAMKLSGFTPENDYIMRVGKGKLELKRL
jgi:ribosomal protein S6--L-glutamate ligase